MVDILSIDEIYGKSKISKNLLLGTSIIFLVLGAFWLIIFNNSIRAKPPYSFSYNFSLISYNQCIFINCNCNCKFIKTKIYCIKHNNYGYFSSWNFCLYYSTKIFKFFYKCRRLIILNFVEKPIVASSLILQIIKVIKVW